MEAPVTPQYPVTVRVFQQRFSATPRGARLARHLAVQQLHGWGIPNGTDVSDRIAVIVAELAANAVTHGRVPGRDFELRLSIVAGGVRVEVSDARGGGARPPGPDHVQPARPLDDSGRGLFLVGELADRWEVLAREPVGTTVWAEVDLPMGMATTG
jgi:anti-sigma regulatory factor (Ser/Thr protein kinase)